MKVKDVPQDKDANYEGHLKIRYGRDQNGKMVKVGSNGCNIEKQATALAWEDISDSLKSTLKMVQQGQLSSLAYHIEAHLMTPSLLAANLNMWGWRIKRHLKPKVFSKLSDRKLSVYADYFSMTIEELKRVPELK